MTLARRIIPCLDVDAGRYWQANQQAQVRQGVLNDVDF